MLSVTGVSMRWSSSAARFAASAAAPRPTGRLFRIRSGVSSAVSVSDPGHAIPVEVNRNGLRTIAFGTGEIDELDLPYLPNNADIQPGDTLSTTGLDGRFPPGYPVAQVTRVQRERGQPFASVTARTMAHLDHSGRVERGYARMLHSAASIRAT